MAFDSSGSVMQRAFVGGEIAPSMGARADQAKYVSGLNICRNFFIQARGGASKRAGTLYVATVKSPTKFTRLLPFIFEGADQTYLLEFGEFYIRFYFHGAPVVVSGVAAWSGATAYVVGDLVVQGGVNYYCILAHTNQIPPNPTYWYPLTGDIYEIPTPYAEAHLRTLQWTQSADIITLVHPNYAVRELKRFSGTRWILDLALFTPWTAAPTGGSGTAGAAGTRTFRYQITAVKADTYEETFASTTITIVNAAVPTPDAPHLLNWTAVTGAVEYNIYADPFNNGVFGHVGTSAANSFRDAGFVPDFSTTPPTNKIVFDSAGNFPSTVAYYQQRIVYGRTANHPGTVWASQVGNHHNFTISTPIQDDDAIEWTLASQSLQPVSHVVGLKKLFVLTDQGEWQVKGDDQGGGTLKPSAINPYQDGGNGATPQVRPCIVQNVCVFVQARGTKLRVSEYSEESGGFQGLDLTIYAAHLFEAHTITAIAYVQEPSSIIYATRDDGALLGLTYLKEQDVLAWHRHDTHVGFFEDVCALPETSLGEDFAYVVVRRLINGSMTRYIEKIASRVVTNIADNAVFMDSALRYTGTPISTVTGLDHLEGQVVAVLGEGVVVFNGDPADPLAGNFTVAAGQITLPTAYGKILVGLRYVADLKTLALDVQGSDIRDKKKNVQNVSLLVEQSPHGFQVGPDENHLFPERPEPWEDASEVATKLTDVVVTSDWSNDGQLFIRHDDPLPFAVLGIIPNLEVGG